MFVKKLLFIFLFSVQFLNLYSQTENKKQERFTKVDYDKICTEVNNPTGKYFLPKLMERFSSFDTTMKYLDYFYLYYGYTCTQEYNPYPTSKYTDTLKQCFENSKDKSDMNTNMLNLCPEIFKELPLEMKYYEYYAMANIYNGDTAKATRILKCVSGIYDAILSTGDGKSEFSAYYVIFVENEYELIRYLDLESNFKQVLTTNRCDKVGLKNNKLKIKELFFNVNRLLKRQKIKK